METKQRIENKVTYSAWVQLGFCSFFFHFPDPRACSLLTVPRSLFPVPRSPFLVLVSSGREQQKCLKFKRKVKMRSQGE